MFWIGLLVGWFTAMPLAVLILAMLKVASDADDAYHRDLYK